MSSCASASPAVRDPPYFFGLPMPDAGGPSSNGSAAGAMSRCIPSTSHCRGESGVCGLLSMPIVLLAMLIKASSMTLQRRCQAILSDC
jgi:hypothetical protein